MAGWITPDPGLALTDSLLTEAAVTVHVDGESSLSTLPGRTSWVEHDISAAYATVPALRTVIDFIARAVSSTPFVAYDRVSTTDRQRLVDGDLVSALRRPGPWTTQAQWLGAITRDRLLTDRWCSLVLYDDGVPQLLRVPPRMVQVEVDAFGDVAGILILAGGKQLRPGPGEVLFWSGYSVDPSTVGTSPIRTVQRLLREMEQSDSYRQRTYANGVRSPFALVRPAEAAPWTPEQRQDFITAFRANYAGPTATNSGGVPLLEDGMNPVEFKGINPKDMEATASRQALLIEMANAYHLPPEILGLRESKYASMQAYRSQLYRDVLGPIFVDLEQTLTAQAVPALGAAPSVYVEANIEAKLRGSFQEQVAYLQTAVGGPFMTRAEGRGVLNLPFIDGTDELIVPLNVIEGGQASPQDSVRTREDTTETEEV